MNLRFRPPTVAGLALALILATPAASAGQTLKIATSIPAGTSFITQLKKAGKKIAERTEGRIQLKLYPGGVMGGDQAVLRKMKIGQLHGAVVTAKGLQEIAAAAQVYSMPFLFRSYAEVDYVRQRIDPQLKQRIRSAGYVVGGIAGGGFTYLFSKKPVRNLDDLAKRRVWVPEGDRITARMFDNAGSKTVSLPVSDVFTSLQTGLIDTVAITPSGAIALQWHTGVNYQTDAKLIFLIGMLVFDQRAFERLDTADREVVRDILHATFERLTRINREDNREASTALRKQGIELVEPTRPPAERGWKDIAEKTLTELENEGRYSGELLDRVRQLIAEYRAQHGE